MLIQSASMRALNILTICACVSDMQNVCIGKHYVSLTLKFKINSLTFDYKREIRNICLVYSARRSHRVCL